MINPDLMRRTQEFLAHFGLFENQFDLEEIAKYLSTMPLGTEQAMLDALFKRLRQPLPEHLMEYRDKTNQKRPYFSHEVYRQRVFDVSPQVVEFEIHDWKLENIEKNGEKTYCVVVNTSLRIESWKMSAFGTCPIYWSTNKPNEPAELGGAFKSAVSNGFVGCCKAYGISVDQISRIKGEITPGNTFDYETAKAANTFNHQNNVTNYICKRCSRPLLQSDVDLIQKFNLNLSNPFHEDCQPEATKKRIRNALSR